MKLEAAKVRRGADRPGVICECGDHAFGALTRGYVALVSPEDIGVFDRKWSVNLTKRHAAAVRILWPERRPQLMARLITDAPDDKVVDHISGDSLDNRRHNLRVCTQKQNSWNCGGHRRRKHDLPTGVVRKREKFEARIKRDGKTYRLGIFPTPEEAAKEYKLAAERLSQGFHRR